MKQTKQFLRPLLMAIVMLVGMLMPQGAWAQNLWVDCETVTISEDASYDMIYVSPGGELIINKGVTLTVTDQIIFQGDDLPYGTVINYGTIIGEGYINKKDRGVLANHGHIDLSGASGNGTFTFYNTGTLGDNINLTPTEECNHAYFDEFTVAATCTHGAGTQYRCYTCYYMWLDETSGALPHNINSHNGINICSSCGHKTYDEPTNGDGSEEDPYQIANAGNLYWFANYTRNEDEYANAILTADIVLNDGTFATDGTFTATGADEPSKPFPWIRIGNADGSYYGTFDGNGHTISGMYVNGRFGLFYNLGGSVVNLGIVNCYIRDNSVTGAICYWNYGTISNCYTTGILSGSYSCGICDTNISGSTISNCYSTCSFVNDIFFDGGGICGTNLGTISNCYTSYDTAIKHNNETASEVYGGVSADRFASGEIAYKLNGSVDGEGHWTAGATDGTQAWYQKLGENGDSYPVLAAADGNMVYYGYEDCLSESAIYSNNFLYADIEDAHVWEDGKCTVCKTECEHDWEEYGEHVHKCNICELETDHDWSNGDSKCAVCEYVCQHKVEDYEMWENGKCTICGYECKHKDSDENGDCDICGIHAQTFASLAALIAADQSYDAVNVTIDDEILMAMPYPDPDFSGMYAVALKSDVQLVAPIPEPALNWQRGGRITGTLKYAHWGKTDNLLTSMDADFWLGLEYTAPAPVDPIVFSSIDELLAADLENVTPVTVTVNGTIAETFYAYEMELYQIVLDNGFVLRALPVAADPEWEVGGTISGTLENVIFIKNGEEEEEVGIVSMDRNIFAELNYIVPKVTIGDTEIAIKLNSDGKYVAIENIVLTDGASFTANVEFIAPSDQVTVARTFTASKPATVMLPFTIDASLVRGATFSAFGGVSYDAEKAQWVATMTSVATGNLQAYKPYIVILEADNETGKVTFDNTSANVATFIVTPEASAMKTADENGWTFQAVNAAKTWAEGDKEIGKAYGFAGKDKNVGGNDIHQGDFVKIAAGASAKPGRCYLVKNDGEPLAARGMTRTAAADELPATITVRFVNSDDETLGIGTLNTETGEMTLEGWYDLNGRIIEQPAKGGIYIHNNKKAILK